MTNSILSIASDAFDYNLVMFSRAFAALMQLAHWIVESLPLFFYCGVWVFVSLVVMLLPAVVIYRAVDWLRKGGLKYSAIRRAQKRNSAQH